MTLKSRVLCCSNNRAAVADVYSPIVQNKKLSALHLLATTEQQAKSTVDTTQTRTSLDKEQVQPNESIFRRTPGLIPEPEEDLSSDDDLLCLKRANPVYESDDEELEIPYKRQRTSTAETLRWEESIEESEEDGYQILVRRL